MIFQGHFEICKLLSENMEEKNPRDLFHGFTPFMHGFSNGHLDVCRFFSDDAEEKTNNPVLVFFYLFKLFFLFLDPKNCLNIGRFWPAYFMAICLVWLVPFIIPFYVYYIRYSMVSVWFLCPKILAILNALSHFFLFTSMFHLYSKKYTKVSCIYRG